ncbi:MAG: cyclic nucleotide-binding domain-containing protein [Deltaproteobacteria bacterium]|nr:cyclic nucleotide-binding domain-containing protein [Deltaproteobacteria bacterium]
MFPSRSDFLYGLSERHLQRLAEIASRAPMTGGELLMHEGRVGEVIYMIERGAVELKTRVDEDFDLPVSVLRDPGQCFGTSALVAPHQYSVSAYCLNEGSLIVFPRVALQGLIEADAETRPDRHDQRSQATLGTPHRDTARVDRPLQIHHGIAPIGPASRGVQDGLPGSAGRAEGGSGSRGEGPKGPGPPRFPPEDAL